MTCSCSCSCSCSTPRAPGTGGRSLLRPYSVPAALGALALVLALAGCPGEGPRLDAPPDVRYGVDPCARCAMILNEERFACAYVTPAGEARRFDDLGCLTAFLAEQPEPVAEVWVHDDGSRAWLRGAQAWYARSATLITPMGTGLLAVKDEATAKARGEALSWDAFKALGPAAWPASPPRN